mmetsp:Transcript_134931/g.269236  ORF Transcript_134931/g.269236 Transcript_134931/m.269236 type:complete len:141 (+) Transcript_134931:43-465(+)
MVTDFIVAVNGVHGDADAMLERCRTDTTVALVCRRGVDITIVFDRHDENVPLGLEFATQHVGESLLVTGICEGIAKDYNERTIDTARHLRPGDRILEVCGHAGASMALQSILAKAMGKLQLSVVRPSSNEFVQSHWRFEH